MNRNNNRMQDKLLSKKLKELKSDYQSIEMSEEQLNQLKIKMKEAKMTGKINKKHRYVRKIITVIASCAAAFLVAIIVLPNTSGKVAYAMERIPVLGQLVKVITFRDYQYASERNNAEIEVPELEISVSEMATDDETVSQPVADELQKTTDEINQEIKQITDELIAEFEKNLKNEEGYQDVLVKSEILATTQDYFTLKLICYIGSGSGYEWNYFYTIDLNTGERLALKDLFREGADYITPISENIKEQMQSQMDADNNVYYWLNDEIEEWNFKSITDETSFYINEKGNIVIGFNEGDVAPMYMGTVEFEIPAEVVAEIRK
ncbi:MAG: RsiV family protein [Lachnospiraceae bacterium]|nr:RsiV family protein [Lachnospiraceae bacterium]